jgi:large subunit ribosomal protein L6
VSRIGKKTITVPEKVNVNITEGKLSAKGPKGELTVDLPEGISAIQEGNEINFTRGDEQKKTKALHGLTRALASNAIDGVNEGFSKTMNINGVGYRAELKGQKLLLTLGYSHQVLVIPPDGITFETPSQTSIKVSGADKQLVGEVSYKIRLLRRPEPYKGKGIIFEGERIRRKAGKTAGK